jgi:hypothetical protein
MPLTRRSLKAGALQPDLAAWAQAVREVARSHQVALADLYASSSAAVQALGQQEADLLARGSVGSPWFDRTHLGPWGSCLFAEQVLTALAGTVLDWPAGRAAPDCNALPAPSTTGAPVRAGSCCF